MDNSKDNFELKNFLDKARSIIKKESLHKSAKNIQDCIVEISSTIEGKAAGSVWLDGESFIRGDMPLHFDSNDIQSGLPWLEKIGMAYWMFGPESVKDSVVIFRWLSQYMVNNGMFFIASKTPVRGNIPIKGDHNQYSPEELHALLTRTAFDSVGVTVENENFRLWSARKSSTLSHDDFHKVEILLESGDWQSAVIELGKIDERLDSLAAVREYALLLAACHDLAGNMEESYGALLEAKRLDPTCARAYCGLGRLSVLDNDLEMAAEFFENAVFMEPCMVAALRGFSMVCEVTGDLQNAYKCIVDASNFRPDDDDLLYEVIRLGNANNAQDEVAAYLNLRASVKEPTVQPHNISELTPQTTVATL